MNLELTLVGTGGYPSKDVTFIDRQRYKVENDSEALDAIVKFIANHISDFTARVNDVKLVNRLETIDSLTIDQFTTLKTLLSFKGIDIIAVYVADNESNIEEPPAKSIEVNILDRNNIIGSFIPFCTKITQLRDEFKVTKVFSKIISMYGLFEDNKFDEMPNPVKSNLNSIIAMEESGVNLINPIALSILNMAFDAMNKDRILIRN